MNCCHPLQLLIVVEAQWYVEVVGGPKDGWHGCCTYHKKVPTSEARGPAGEVVQLHPGVGADDGYAPFDWLTRERHTDLGSGRAHASSDTIAGAIA